MGPVPVFETRNEVAADIIVEKDRTPAFEHRPAKDTAAAQPRGAVSEFKRHPSGMAERLRDKSRIVPAGSTQGTGFRDQRITGQALGRQDSI